MPGMGDVKFYENKKKKGRKGYNDPYVYQGATIYDAMGGYVNPVAPGWSGYANAPIAPVPPMFGSPAVNPSVTAQVPITQSVNYPGYGGYGGYVPATGSTMGYQGQGQAAAPNTTNSGSFYETLLRNYLYNPETGRWIPRNATNSFGGTDLGLTYQQLEKMRTGQDPGSLNQYGQPLGTAAPFQKKGVRGPGSKGTGEGSQGGSFFGTTVKSKPRNPKNNTDEQGSGVSNSRYGYGAVFRP